MNKIINKEHFSEKVFKLEIEAPLIAKSRKAGHFVIVRVGEKGERMPLTIAGADVKKGTITLVVQEVGLSSTRLCELNEGDYITDVVGPLGQATHIENFGTVVCAGGGVGVAYKPEQTPVDFKALSKGVEEAYNRILVANGLGDVALAYECGRMVTGPFGYLVSTAIHKKDIYRHYIGLDSCMANLMRPALYGSYHHITVMGKENAPKDHVYDVTGSLCENNDKFAIQRELPKIDIGDRIIIHDAGAHGHSMGFNYNGKLRSAELLLHKDGSVTQIRRAETYDDLFGTLDFSNL